MFLFLVSLAVVPILPGILFMKIFYRRNHRPYPGMLHAYISGLLLCLVFCGVINALGVLLNKSLSQCALWYCLGILWMQFLSGIVLVFWWKPRRASLRKLLWSRWAIVRGRIKRIIGRTKQSPLVTGVFLIFIFLILFQVIRICRSGYVYLAGDMTLETVQSFLDQDALYQVHPLTGKPYQVGVPLRIKILCLPTLYAVLCSVFGLAPQLVVWTLMPVYFLLCSYMVYYMLGRRLFEGKALYVGYFLVLVALLLGWGTYAYGMDGLGMLYRGFRGESIRAGILLPYVWCQVLDGKWWSVLLCMGVELFIVWTLYGLGACLAVTVGMLLVMFIRRFLAERSGKEASVCGK